MKIVDARAITVCILFHMITSVKIHHISNGEVNWL